MVVNHNSRCISRTSTTIRTFRHLPVPHPTGTRNMVGMTLIHHTVADSIRSLPDITTLTTTPFPISRKRITPTSNQIPTIFSTTSSSDSFHSFVPVPRRSSSENQHQHTETKRVLWPSIATHLTSSKTEQWRHSAAWTADMITAWRTKLAQDE